MPDPIPFAMLIDDEEIDQKSFWRIIKRSGLIAHAEVFTYADEALAYLKAHPDQQVDVIFLDINMPRMNGFEFIDAANRELRAHFAKMVVVMLTTSMDPKDRERAESSAVVRKFLNKPLSEKHIEEVARLLQAECNV